MATWARNAARLRPSVHRVGPVNCFSVRRLATSARKGPESSRRTNAWFNAASASIPHPEKAATGGEDASYCIKSSVGVADGVGGWSGDGVDPSLYPKWLMKSIAAKLESASNPVIDPIDILTAAASENPHMGSTTVCMIMAHEGRLTARHMGDSGFQVWRPTPDANDGDMPEWTLVYETVEQTHYFNCPVQLGHQTDQPEASVFLDVPVRHGDVIVALTDGVLDNVFTKEIRQLLVKSKFEASKQYLAAVGAGQEDSGVEAAARQEMQDIADSIAQHAFSRSSSPKNVTPFELGAAKQGMKYPGGKPDDITVVAALYCARSTTE